MEEQNQIPSAPKKNMTPLIVIVLLILLIGGYVFSKGLMNKDLKDKNSEKTEMQDQDGDVGEIPAVVPPQNTTTTSTPENTPPSSSTSSAEVKTFTVNGFSFGFTPSEIKVNKGDRVKIVFENTGGFHDFVIDEFNAKTKQIQGGATETIEFIADKQGTFEYYCSVGKHREMGMKGNLVVQ